MPPVGVKRAGVQEQHVSVKPGLVRVAKLAGSRAGAYVGACTARTKT